jgi:hypothetical protein
MKRFLAAGLTTLMLGAAMVTAAAPATAVTGPGWSRVWVTPVSYCPQARAEYAAKGYITTACVQWSATGAYFDYHR